MITKLVTPYLQLARVDRLSPAWMLLWPSYWALWFSYRGLPPISIIALFAAGAGLMRSFGCIVNDLSDRNIDKKVQRTKNRPLASGRLSVEKALIFALIVAAFSATLLYFLSIEARVLASIGFVLTCLYPLSKRYSGYPQCLLGITFALGVPMAYAMSPSWGDIRGLGLYVCVALWIVAYDTIYALQDIQDDKKTGVGSLAITLGDTVVIGIGVLYTLFWLGLGLIGYLYHGQAAFFISWLIAGILLVWQVVIVQKKATTWYAFAFQLNQWIGFVVWLGVILTFVRP